MAGELITQEDLQGHMTLLDDVRCDLIEAQKEARDLTKAIQTTCDTLLRRLDEPVVPGLQGSIDEIVQVVRADKQPARLDWKRLAGLVCGVALLSSGLTWYGSRTPAVVTQRAKLMEHVHGVLVERYTSLPADVKTKLTTVYGQHGFALGPQAGSKP